MGYGAGGAGGDASLPELRSLVQQFSGVNENQGVCLEPGYRRQKDVRLPTSGRGLQDSCWIPEQVVEGLFLEVIELAFGRRGFCSGADSPVNDLESNTLRSQCSDHSREIPTG